MNINKNVEGKVATLALEGRLDTQTAPELEKVLDETLPGIETLNFDLKDLAYTSSAGLRLFLKAQKTMSKQGKMVLKNVNDEIMEVFDITGFTDILTIE